jgi:translation initiation factor IF-2
VPDGSAGGERRRRGGRQGLAPGRGTPAVAGRGSGPGSGVRPGPRPASGPGPSGDSAQSSRRGHGRPGHPGRPTDPGTARRAGTAAAPAGRKAGWSAAVGCWRSWLGGVDARRGQGGSAGCDGRDGTGRDRPRRTAGPGAASRRTGQPRCTSGRARSDCSARSGGQARTDGPPCRQAHSRGQRARPRRGRRGKRHQAGSPRGRGPAIRPSVAGQGPACSGQGPDACEPGASPAAVG